MRRPETALQLAAAGAIAAIAFGMARSLEFDSARFLEIVRRGERVPVLGALCRFVVLGNVPHTSRVDGAMLPKLLEPRRDYYLVVGIVMSLSVVIMAVAALR